MNLLLDTHAFVWWMTDPVRLSSTAYEIIQDPDNRIYVSAAVVWEVATKHRIGKLPQAEGLVDRLVAMLTDARIEALPVNLSHAATAGRYGTAHRDPFDRMIAAQAEIERMAVVTNDPAFREFPVEIVW